MVRRGDHGKVGMGHGHHRHPVGCLHARCC
jgi:hypothetical protein